MAQKIVKNASLGKCKSQEVPVRGLVPVEDKNLTLEHDLLLLLDKNELEYKFCPGYPTG